MGRKMKSFYLAHLQLVFYFVCLIVFLASCSPTQQKAEIRPTIITVEITKLVQITNTPVPQPSSTLTPTLEPIHARATSYAEMIGTPIVATEECYETAFTQQEMNSCAAYRESGLEKEMEKLVNALQERYKRGSEKDLKKFLAFQQEWEYLSKRECEFLAGYTIEDGGYKGGSMAPLNYWGCLEGKYEDRLRELQQQLFVPG